MARNLLKINSDITVVHGADQALGYFIDVIDIRFAEFDTGSGEGFVFEWSSRLGCSKDILGLDLADLSEKYLRKVLPDLCNEKLKFLKMGREKLSALQLQKRITDSWALSKSSDDVDRIGYVIKAKHVKTVKLDLPQLGIFLIVFEKPKFTITHDQVSTILDLGNDSESVGTIIYKEDLVYVTCSNRGHIKY